MTRSINSATYVRFRELLIECRNKAGLAQTELADKLGRPQQFVSRYELGERRLDVGEFLEIADHLGIDPAKMIRELSAWRKKRDQTS